MWLSFKVPALAFAALGWRAQLQSAPHRRGARGRGAVAKALGALLLLQACAAPADVALADSTSAEPLQERVVRLISKHSGLALDVIGISRNQGAELQQWPYWGSTNQRWRLVARDNGYDVVSVNSNMCLDVWGISKEVGAKLQQWPCWGSANQRWRFEAADGGSFKLRNVNSGFLLDVSGISKDPGARIHQWPDVNGPNQMWLVQVIDANGNPTGETGPQGGGSTPPPVPPPPSPPPPSGNFGNRTMHAEKIGFYMVPDLEDPYRAGGGPSGDGYCAWGMTQASLIKFHQLMPSALVRWDNETGHYTDTPENVETMVRCHQRAGVNMIITATAVDGYNNWWANGNRTPSFSLIDFANGPYVQHTADLMRRYSVVKLVETANEPDGPWFNSDGDNVGNFEYYYNRVRQAVGDTGRIVGPSAAFRTSGIWNWWANRGDLVNVSYHTYDGFRGLIDMGGRNLYITEYGGFDLDPGAILADLWQAERQGKLDGSVKVLNYMQINDNGSNRGALNSHEIENGHFAFRDWFRALTLYQAVTTTAGTRGYFDDGNPDFVAADSGNGAFAALVWNPNGGGNLDGQRRVPGTSLVGGKPLYVVHLNRGENRVASCMPMANQNKLTASASGNTVTLTIRGLEARTAAYISTRPCDDLAN